MYKLYRYTDNFTTNTPDTYGFVFGKIYKFEFDKKKSKIIF